MRKVIPFFILTISFASCGDDPELNNKLLLSHTPLIQQIFYTDDSLMHGIALGMTQEEVKKSLAPGDSITEEWKDYLLIEGTFDSSRYYTKEYEFDSAGLFAITVDIYITDEHTATAWFSDVNAYFTDRYGPATDDGIALTWEVKTGKRPARVELMEDTEYPYGKLSVYYYDLSFIPMESDTLPVDSVFLPTDALQLVAY